MILVAFGVPVLLRYSIIPKYIRHASSIDCIGETVLTSIHDRKIDIYHKLLNRYRPLLG